MKYLLVFEKWLSNEITSEKEIEHIKNKTLLNLKKLSSLGVLDDEEVDEVEIYNIHNIDELLKFRDILEASNIRTHLELISAKELGYSMNSKCVIIVFEYEGDKLFADEDWTIYYYDTKRNQIEYEIPLVDHVYKPRDIKDKYTDFNDRLLGQNIDEYTGE